jgi:NAD(P)-dependent dehydrogenase (short-subunit alcohol dehydrogenase family)
MVLRDDLLAGRRVAVAGAAPARLAALGADVRALDAPLDDEDALAAAAAGLGSLAALVVDAAGPFGAGGLVGLRRALDLTWNAVRAVATAAWIPDGGDGAIVLLTPRPAAGPHAEAARAGLENMARTLSIEWARFAIRPMVIAPGDAVRDDEVAELAAYLVSDAGAYFSGSALSPA